jgi:hydrogenase nickel incorporation protein HypA/HybF
MHELSIAMSIVDIAREESERRDGVGVEAIHLKIGALSGVVKDALLSAYELAAAETSFASCRLIFEDVPVVVYCQTCRAERPIESIQMFRCAACGTPASEVLQGRELQISAMELAE